MKKLPIVLILLGILVLITCAALQWIVLPMFYGEQVVQGMRSFYGPTGSAEHWKKFGLPSPAALDPTLLSVYVFNVTNSKDVIQSGLKPQLQEVGPYVYIVEKIIEEVDDHETNAEDKTENNDDTDTITFREKKIYHFSQHHSGNLSELDELYVLNIPFLKAMEQSDVPRKSKLVQDALLSVNRYTIETSVFIKRPVKEILFSGFHQPALDKLHKNMDKNNPPFLHDGKFGFLYPKNGTESKLYKVHSGLRKRKRTRKTQRVKGEEFIDYGQIIEYDGQEDLHYWANVNDNRCNKIIGSPEGMLFAPLAEQGSTLSLFRPEICRSVRFELSEHKEYYGELEGYRYVLPPDLLHDSKDNFENNCFCPGPEVHTSLNKSCRHNGTLSNCSEGFPFITSLPHFLDDQRQFVTQTIGLSPNRSKHESFVDLEPITGLALKSSVKFQINYELLPSASNDDLTKIPESGILFPLIWTDEIKSLNFILSGGITQNIMFPLSMVQIGKWSSCALGLLLIATGIFIGLLRARKKSYPDSYFNTMLISRDSQRITKMVSPKQNRKVSFSNGNSKSNKSKTIDSSPSQGWKSKMKKSSSKKNSTSLPQMTQSQIDLTEPLQLSLNRQHSRLSIRSQHGKSPSSLSTFVPPSQRKRASSVQLTNNNNGAGYQQTMTNNNQDDSTIVNISGDNDNENRVKSLEALETLDETNL